ncbi:hypothetical protein HR081_11300 [Staphylococcus schleiferi subsp. coagulans]|uniref:Phage protein n=1 Tax=Staphylococcus coagulans TaxID=74706 RepID=A0A9X0TLP2_9STAP|nr:hypothetical protein [Staphylococcus coagulans]MBA8777455.1 hypothetical protein [Staphylococcus coagulans]
MKIKFKKEMNLPQLIEWAWENDVRSRMFIGSEDGIVKFGIGGLVTNLEYIDSDETFKVEVEEEITEETILPRVLRIYSEYYDEIDKTEMASEVLENMSINEIKKYTNEDTDNELTSVHLINEDYNELTLLWSGGYLVR